MDLSVCRIVDGVVNAADLLLGLQERGLGV